MSSFLSLYQEYHLEEEENQQICFHPLSHRNSVHIKVMTSHQVNWPRDPLQWSHYMDFLKSEMQLHSDGLIKNGYYLLLFRRWPFCSGGDKYNRNEFRIFFHI